MDYTDATDFASTARGALRFLRGKFGFNLWMITRNDGEQSVVLDSEGDHYGIERHMCFPTSWEAPRVEFDSSAVLNSEVLKMQSKVSIGAYIGMPLTNQDGISLGTLCALDPKPQPSYNESDISVVEMVAKTLSRVLSAELRTIEFDRQKERVPPSAETDGLTGLFNRAGWDRMLHIEEGRCQRYGSSAFIVVVDLDGLTAVNELRGYDDGDKLIRRAGKVLRKTVRDSDVVARIGGDEFGVLGMSCHPSNAGQILKRIQQALERAGVRASSGVAAKVPALELGELWLEASQLMHSEKAARKLRIRAGHLRRISRSQVFRAMPPRESTN